MSKLLGKSVVLSLIMSASSMSYANSFATSASFETSKVSDTASSVKMDCSLIKQGIASKDTLLNELTDQGTKVDRAIEPIEKKTELIKKNMMARVNNPVFNDKDDKLMGADGRDFHDTNDELLRLKIEKLKINNLQRAVVWDAHELVSYYKLANCTQ